MSKLGANIAELEKAQAVFAEVIPEMEALKTEVVNILNEMEAGWHGKASEMYLNSMRRQVESMDIVMELVKDFKEYATAIGDAMKEADRAMDAMQSSVSKIKHGGGGRNI